MFSDLLASRLPEERFLVKGSLNIDLSQSGAFERLTFILTCFFPAFSQ